LKKTSHPRKTGAAENNMKKKFGLTLALSLGLLVSSLAIANDAVLGALLGGGAGAIVGQSIGGRNGAVVGGALGAATGVVIASNRVPSPPASAYYPPQQVYYPPQQVYYPPPQVYYPPQQVYYTPPVRVIPPPVYYGSYGGAYYAGRHHGHEGGRHYRD
jgi:hypothetical protein